MISIIIGSWSLIVRGVLFGWDLLRYEYYGGGVVDSGGELDIGSGGVNIFKIFRGAKFKFFLV
jgi:hypothetical protein